MKFNYKAQLKVTVDQSAVQQQQQKRQRYPGNKVTVSSWFYIMFEIQHKNFFSHIK